jgi:hypothetical protein
MRLYRSEWVGIVCSHGAQTRCSAVRGKFELLKDHLIAASLEGLVDIRSLREDKIRLMRVTLKQGPLATVVR